MYDIIEQITGLVLSDYDPTLVFMVTSLLTFIVFDTCYVLLCKFFDFLLGKRR